MLETRGQVTCLPPWLPADITPDFVPLDPPQHVTTIVVVVILTDRRFDCSYFVN